MFLQYFEYSICKTKSLQEDYYILNMHEMRILSSYLNGFCRTDPLSKDEALGECIPEPRKSTNIICFKVKTLLRVNCY